MTKIWRLASLVRQKDGSTAEEEQYILANAKPDPAAVQVPRMPRFGERWTNGGFAIDKSLVDDHQEAARLRRLGPVGRQEEAIAVAQRNVIKGLLDAGVVSAKQAEAVSASLEDPPPA